MSLIIILLKKNSHLNPFLPKLNIEIRFMYILIHPNIVENAEIDQLVKNSLDTFPIPALIKKDVEDYCNKIIYQKWYNSSSK